MNQFLEPLFTAKGWASLLSLSLLEIVLGIDNIVFVSIISGRVRSGDQNKARLIGLSLALFMRILLLTFIAWIVGISKPLIHNFFGLDLSVHDLILFGGGLFLIYKSTYEIHQRLEGEEQESGSLKTPTILSAVIQIILLDLVFSFDSILTAIGLVEDPQKDLIIMIVAVILAVIIMLIFSKSISNYINSHPTIKMLALSFLLMVGVLLVAEGFHVHVPKGYIYFAIAFSLFVEMLNLRVRKRSNPVKLKSRMGDCDEDKK
jgi:predicted tellurium resistance membrane protein TerC